jgi:site-specific DNA recombinase
MTKIRALGVIRKSTKPDEESSSLPAQREIVEHFCESQGWTLVGFAEDVAKSAFHIAPEKRKAIRAWLERYDEYDVIVYWRQDRLVRRAWDFMGMVKFAQLHGKGLYSATEGTGDVSKGAGVLVGFVGAWQAEQESENTSLRVKDIRATWEAGRWPGGRAPYGFKGVKNIGKPGYHLVVDKKTAPVTREAALRVIAGESVNAVCGRFNSRGTKSADGKAWTHTALIKLLRNRALMNGILSPAEYGTLQDALGSPGRVAKRRTKTENMILDLVFCGKCGAKLYRWRNPTTDIVYGRCRFEMARADSDQPCSFRRVNYDKLITMIDLEMTTLYGDWRIEERIPRGNAREVRLDDIDHELISLSADYASKRIDRAEFLERQMALLDEQSSLEEPNEDDAPQWRDTGETVADRWASLTDAERRLWLLRTGITWRVTHEGHEISLATHLPDTLEAPSVRERIVAPADFDASADSA